MLKQRRRKVEKFENGRKRKGEKKREGKKVRKR